MNYWLLSFIMLFFSCIHPSATWNFTLALQGEDDFIRFSSLDAEGIITPDKSKTHFILAQIEKIRDYELWRYQLVPSGLELIALETLTTPEDSFTQLLTWSMNNFPASYNAFAMWGKETPLPLSTWGACLKKATSAANKKLDLFACNGYLPSSIEAAFECAPYCSFLVSSELEGVNDDYAYAPLFRKIVTATLSPRDVAQAIVTLYAELYPPREGIYNTQTAVDLSLMPLFSSSFDVFTRNAHTFLKKGSPARRLFNAAYSSAQKIDTPGYIDLISFLTQLYRRLIKDFNESPCDKEFVRNVKALIETTKKMIVAHTRCIGTEDTINGLCIYCPAEKIDSSYLECSFAKNTRWLALLNKAFGVTKN